jgi:hypothetical protein
VPISRPPHRPPASRSLHYHPHSRRFYLACSTRQPTPTSRRRT